MKKEPRFFMAPLKPHRKMTVHGPVNTGRFLLKLYGPRLQGQPGWFHAHAIVENAKEAKKVFQEWIDETEAYIKENNVQCVG